MHWFTQILNLWLTSLTWIGGLAVVFLVLTRFSPCNPGQNWWADRRAALTDLVYWLVLPLFTQVGRVALLVLGVLLVYGNAPPDDWAVRRWPLWAQCLGVLLVQDVILYWLHRLFHTRGGWRFHAVHHSPEVLDWTSTQRFHPVNAILEFAVADVTVLLLGFSPDALILLGPINLAYSVMVHANLNWTFGPLRFLLVSPVYHRWHHTTAEEGRDRNFASTFPFLDLLFGTYHMPVGVLPGSYGASDGDVPRGFTGQMFYPFRGVGAWARRHPVPASVGGVAVVVGCVLGVMRLTESIETPANPPTAAEMASALPAGAVNLLPVPDGSPAASVAVSVRHAHVFLGRSDGSLVVRNAAGTEQSVAAHRGRVNALAVSPNETLLASGGGDGVARLWDVSTFQPVRTLRGHEAGVMSVAVAADGWAATGTADGVVRVWNPDGELAHVHRTGVSAPVHSVAVGDGGGRVAVAQLSTAFVWDTAANGHAPLVGHADLVYALGIAADGRVVSGGYDGKVKVWDATGKCAATLSGHAGPVYAVGFTRDGKRVLSGGADQTVRVWQSGGEPVRVLGGHTGLVFAASTDDAGRRIAATGKDGVVSVWEVPDTAVLPASATTPGR